MANLIGHNNPPKDRKVNWKSISVNEWIYKDLQRCAEHITYLKNCFRLLDGKEPIKMVSIPYALELIMDQYILGEVMPSVQDNGRDIYEQTYHKLLRTHNSQKGLVLKNGK
jgi:hypothetical protein